MRLRTRLHLFGLATALITVALVVTVLWGASTAGRVLATRQRNGRQAEALRSISVELQFLALGSGDSTARVTRARRALELAGPEFGPADGAEELQELARFVDGVERPPPAARAGAVAEGVDLEHVLLGPMARLSALATQRDAEASRVTAETIARAKEFAASLALIAAITALVGAVSVTPRLRRGLAALEAGARRVSAGDLATRIAFPGEDELASLGTTLDSMGVQLGLVMISREEAEALVRERTAELERAKHDLAERVAQLEAARIELDAADRLVAADRLARGLTHELNNPLAILLADVDFAIEELAARVAADGASDDEVCTALKEARQAGQRIALIVRELMSFSRERAIGDRGVADLVETLHQALRLASPEIRRHADLVTDLPAGQVFVQGSQARLGQVFLELLLGAASAVASRAGARGLVSLSLRHSAGGAVVEVRDDGPPIPEELKDHLFDPFYLPTEGFTAGGVGLRGAGLGMASCLGVVQAASGRIEVDSTPASGTVFRVWLPDATSVSRVALHAKASGGAARRPRLLVIDVDPFECATIYRSLSKDFDVAPHSSVPSALAILRAGDRFDLILCAKACGQVVAEALRADCFSQERLLVLVVDGGVDAEQAPGAPGADRLERPVTADAVLDLLRRRVGPGAT